MSFASNVNKALSEFGETSSSLAQSLSCFRAKVWASMAFCLVRYGARPIDYWRFEFYNKSSRRRNQCLTFIRYKRLYRRLMKEAYSHASISADKEQEYRIFSEFVHRPWISVSRGGIEEVALTDFVGRHGPVIAKPSRGEQGKGVTQISDAADLKAFLESIGDEVYVLEGKVYNCRELRELNPSSLNTLRVVTMIDNEGLIHVLGAWLRVGAIGKVVDNWGAGGVGYNVDIETGMIDRAGRDKKNRSYIYHPGTDKCMVGFRIPNFKNVLESVKKMAALTPYARYVGWDIAITEDGIDLIEMNFPPGHDMMQSFENPVYDQIRSMLK